MKTSYTIPFSAQPLSKTLSAVFIYLAYGILFLLFAGLASVVSPELMQPTQTGKSFAFAYLLMVTTIFFLLHKLFKERSQIISLTVIDILLGVLFVYLTLNRYLLQETWGFSLRYYELIGLGILYVLLRQMDKDIYPWIFVAVLVSGIIQAVYGNLQLYGFYPSHHSGFKITGSFFNPGPYAGFLSTVFPVPLGVYLFRRSIFEVQGLKFYVKGLKVPSTSKQVIWNKKLKTLNLKHLILEWLPLVGIFSILLVLPASQSRAAWLATGVSGLYVLEKKYQWAESVKAFLNTSMKSIAASLVLVVMSLGIAYGLYAFKPGSADGRLLVWKVTTSMFVDSPWIGHGFDRFKAEYMNYQAAYFLNDVAQKGAFVASDVYYAFNEPLQFATENGTMGVAILSALLLFTFTSKSTKNTSLLHVVKAGIISIIVFSLFSYPLQILPIKLIAILLMATAARFQNGFAWELKNINWPSSFLVRGMASGTIVIGMAVAIVSVSKLRQAYKDWATAYDLYQMGLYDQSLEVYEKASPAFVGEGDFLMNYGKALSMADDHEKAVKTLLQAENHLNTTIIQTALGDSYKALKNYEEAERAYFDAWYMVPSRFYPKYLLAKLYDENCQPEKAVKTAQELIEKEVKVESMAIEEIKAEMEKIIGVIQGSKLD